MEMTGLCLGAQQKRSKSSYACFFSVNGFFFFVELQTKGRCCRTVFVMTCMIKVARQGMSVGESSE